MEKFDWAAFKASVSEINSVRKSAKTKFFRGVRTGIPWRVLGEESCRKVQFREAGAIKNAIKPLIHNSAPVKANEQLRNPSVLQTQELSQEDSGIQQKYFHPNLKPKLSSKQSSTKQIQLSGDY